MMMSAMNQKSTPNQDAEKVRQRRSRIAGNPQRGPGRLTTRRRAQTWCSLYVAPCAPEGTPPVRSSAAALLGIRRVSDFGELSRAARQGWAGEKSGLFEHPEAVFTSTPY